MEDLLEAIGKDLPPAQARETYQTLAKILGNILKNPGEEKFRSLKKENKMISEKVLRSGNAVSLLLAIGFDDDAVMYRLPSGTDLEMARMAHDLLECIILSSSEEPAPAPVAVTSTTAAVPVSVVLSETAATKAAAAKAAIENPQGFGRRNLVDQKRQDQAEQLQAARAARGAQFAENPVAAVGAVGGLTPEANGYPAAGAEAPDATAAKKTKEGAFNFKDRNKAEQEKVKAANGLEEMRRAQKDKYKEWEKDPNAKKQEAYHAPPSVAGGAKADEGWFSGWFGGSSNSNGSSSKPQQPERRGPRIKGVADLPKPPRGGG